MCGHRSNSARFTTMADHKCKWSVATITCVSLEHYWQMCDIMVPLVQKEAGKSKHRSFICK